MNGSGSSERYLNSSRSSVVEHAYTGLDNMEFNEDMAHNYNRLATMCRQTLESRMSVSEARYIESLEHLAGQALGEFLALAEFHEKIAEKDRLKVDDYLSRSLQESGQ